jgi:hypothetical protein
LEKKDCGERRFAEPLRRCKPETPSQQQWGSDHSPHNAHIVATLSPHFYIQMPLGSNGFEGDGC